MPIWSKLKRQIMDLVCDELKERIGIYATIYRGTQDHTGKVWLEFDRKVIFEANTLEWEIEYYKLSYEIQQINHCTDYKNKNQSKGYYRALHDAENILVKKHKMEESGVYNALIRYLNSSFEDNLQSNDDIARIFCLLDKRLGKRRLSKMVIRKDDCDAVKILYSERCKVLGINKL